MVYYLYETSKYDYKMWDVDTVTAADFTVEYIITEQAWRNFLKKEEAKTDESLLNVF